MGSSVERVCVADVHTTVHTIRAMVAVARQKTPCHPCAHGQRNSMSASLRPLLHRQAERGESRSAQQARLQEVSWPVTDVSLSGRSGLLEHSFHLFSTSTSMGIVHFHGLFHGVYTFFSIQDVASPGP